MSDKRFLTETKEYCKKPIVVEAYQTDKEFEIETLEGTMKASIGDFIITGVHGEQYPCKPDIFWETYEEPSIMESKPLDLHTDFTRYEELITKINANARLLVKTETKYEKESDELLSNASKHKTETGEDIIKQKYGGNNDKTRKKYVEETLSDLADEIQEIKFKKDEYNRELRFIERLIDMKIQLIRYGGE